MLPDSLDPLADPEELDYCEPSYSDALDCYVQALIKARCSSAYLLQGCSTTREKNSGPGSSGRDYFAGGDPEH